MIAIEIELKSPDPANDIYALRKYLQENVEGLQIHIKEQPVPQGQMGIGLVSTLLTFVPEPVLNGTMEVVTKIAVENIYEKVLKPLYHKWIGDRKEQGASLEILSTLTDDDSKIHFLENSSGKTQVFTGLKYAIDTGKTRALLIGVGEFDNNFPSIPPVKGNLEDLYQVLADKRHIGLPRENITVSYNETQKEIIKHLIQVGRAEDTHTLLIYFAGHGFRTDIKKLALIARDSEKIDDEILSGIDFDFISNRIMKSSTAKQKILILDACHSGIATQGDDDMIQAADVKGSYILASSPGDEVSYFDKGGRNTYFTGTVVEVLKNGIDSANDMLALEDIYDYARDHLAEKKFPHPIAKSELNIPPSNFFIARNPLFSPDKIKQGARKLFKERRLDEALDAYRELIKKYPDDIQLRKEFEECEMELSFARLVEEANRNYYQYQNIPAAYELYRKAARLKYDGAVQEKIRDCESRLRPQEVNPATELADDLNYKEYVKCAAKKDDKGAWYYLNLLQKRFPGNTYVNEQIRLLEKKAAPNPGEAVETFNRLMNAGQPEKALQLAIRQAVIHANEPAWEKLKEQAAAAVQKKKGDRSRAGRRVIQIVSSVVTAAAAFFWFRSSNHGAELEGLSFKQMTAMLNADSARTFPLLEKAEKDNDSISLIFGNYFFRNKKNYELAKSYYEKADKLPRASTHIGELYYFNDLKDDKGHSKAIEYFKQADSRGGDTVAWNYLGWIALGKYQDGLDLFSMAFSSATAEQNYNEALNWFQKGSDKSVLCASGEAYTYYTKAKYLFEDSVNSSKRNLSFPLMAKAAEIYLGNSWFMTGADSKTYLAIEDLAYMYNAPGGRPDISRQLYQVGVKQGDTLSMFNLASMYLRAEGGDYNCRDAFDLLIRAKNINFKYSSIYSNLGYIYENGCGGYVEKDLAKAKDCYTTGAYYGSEYCKRQLARLK